MSSDKDDVKAPEEGAAVEPTVESEAAPAAEPGVESEAAEGEDPSLTDDTPEATDEAAAEAGTDPVEADAPSEDSTASDEPDAAVAGGGDGGGDDDDNEAVDDEEEGEEDEEAKEGAMSLLDHLGELRIRLTKAFIAIGVGMVACYGFAEQMFDILMQPMIDVFQKQAANNPMLDPGFYADFGKALKEVLVDKGFQHSEQMQVFVDALQQSLMQLAQEGHFQYTYPAEAFFAQIKISIVAGIFLVSPYVFAQIWGFIAPGLYAHERKMMIPMALMSALFFTGGALFGYFQVFPYAFDFFAGFSTEGIQFTPKLNEYLSFCLKLLFAFGFVFELPLFIFFLARMGLVSSTGLRKKRKYAILIGFVLAAVLTPPDPFTQCLMPGRSSCSTRSASGSPTSSARRRSGTRRSGLRRKPRPRPNWTPPPKPKRARIECKTSRAGGPKKARPALFIFLDFSYIQ
jgi:sec-independent protein translocase protein TatC